MINENILVNDLFVNVHKEHFQDYQTGAKGTYYSQKDVFDCINSQPKIGGWIPCSERLPEDGVKVLVWFEYFRYGEYNRLFQTIGISYTYNGKWSGFVNDSSGWSELSIFAWQPLPEAYHGQMD